MAFDAFISYSSKDKTTADAACAALESAGVRCWIAPRDIPAGVEYAAGIIEGLDACRIMVLIFSSSANASPQIHREIEHGVSKGLTIIPFRIEEIAPTKAMEYHLGSIHWLDALTPPLAKHLGQLVEQVKANLRLDAAAATPADVFEKTAAKEASFGGHHNIPNRPHLQAIALGTIGVLSAAVFLLWRFLPSPQSVPDHTAAASGTTAPAVAVPQLAPQPTPVSAAAFVITRSAPFGGNGGAPFDDTNENPEHLPISALKIVENLSPGDTTQRIIGSLQAQWGDQVGPLHGGKGPFAQPAQLVKFATDEKIGRVDVNWRSYQYPTSDNTPPQWIAGLAIWTDSRVYTFGEMTSGTTNQCILAYGEILLGFFGRSGSYIDQIGCIIGKAK